MCGNYYGYEHGLHDKDHPEDKTHNLFSEEENSIYNAVNAFKESLVQDETRLAVFNGRKEKALARVKKDADTMSKGAVQIEFKEDLN